jgi:diguanylate cyclase (GGDEF)-like protein
MRDDGKLEETIAALLGEEQYREHPLRAALSSLFERYQDHLTQLERLTSISDGYQTALRERNQTITDRYARQMRQLKKIVRISDQYQQMLRESNETLKTTSTRDPLTGLANRRLMLERLQSETAIAERRLSPFTIALIDIDHFKLINDNFGHQAGDEVLIAIAHTLADGLRAYDVCARWGGEEFMALMPHTTGADALEIAVRLRRRVNELAHPALSGQDAPTISIGIAEYHLNTSFSEAIKRADGTLYEAKSSGRDRIVLAP